LSSWLELLPGGMAAMFWAQEAFSFVCLAGGVWLLGRKLRLTERESAMAILLAETAGGVGWLWIHHAVARFAPSASEIRTLHGDFVVSTSSVPSLEMLPPLYPRDLSLALAPVCIWCVLRGLESPRRPGLVAAGSLAGAVTLIGPVSAFVVVVTAITLMAVHRRRWVALACFVASFVCVLLVWVVPFLIHLVRLHGLEPKIARPGVSGFTTVTGTGLIVVLGLVGLILIRRGTSHVDGRSVVILVAVPSVIFLVLLVFALRSVGGVGPLGRAQRYLPSLVLMLAFPAAITLVSVAKISRYASALVAVVIAASACSYVLATAGLVSLTREYAAHSALHCPPSPVITVGDQVAVVNAPHFPGANGVRWQRLRNAIDDNVFRNTGAFVLLRVPTSQLRYKGALTHTLSQGGRLLATRRLEQGERVAGIQWILSPIPANVTGSRLVGTCRIGTPAGMKSLRLYHTASAG
jgi:hypothetical protein